MNIITDYNYARGVLASLSDHNVELVLEALDAFVRVHLGQVSAAFDPLIRAAVMRPTVFSGGTFGIQGLRNALEGVQAGLTGMRHGSPAIGNPEVDDNARSALNIMDRLQGKMSVFWEDGKPA